MKKTLSILTAFFVLAACGGQEPVATPTAPAAPEGLKLHSAGETSLVFQWNQTEGAAAYDWQLLQDGTRVDEGRVKTRNKSLEGLTAGTKYRFGVRSVGEDETLVSSWAYLEAETKTDAVDPGTGTDPTPDLSAKYAEFQIPADEEDGLTRAFPGAEGGGMFATGGRGGTVYHVTNLSDNGPGSLRYGLAQSGKRTIVFDVAGIIELSSKLSITKGDVTIAGQTAPGDGICLKNYTFAIAADNVVVRFIRCRMGDEKQTEDDAMQIMGKGTTYKNIVIDHCSVSWCTDECASFYGVKDFSFQWNIVSESLRNSVHGKGAHGYGGLWGGENATYHHNLLAHHDSRNPRIDHDYLAPEKGPLSLVNNVIYNWSGNSCYGGESASNTGEYRKYNILNNYYKPGPRTPSNHIWFLDITTSCSNCADLGQGPVVPGHFYMTGNYMDGKSAMTSDNWNGGAHGSSDTNLRASSAFAYAANPTSLHIHAAQDAFQAVLGYAGASLARDPVDTRVVGEAKEGKYTYQGSATQDKSGNALTGDKLSTKGLIDTQTDVGGWPEYTSTTAENIRVRDSDGDGIPDWFEEEFGLNGSDKSDAAQFGLDPQKRYTNLEMYLHYLVKDIVAAQAAGGTYSQL